MDEQRTNWWSRNWLWFVPVGCLGTVALCGGFVAAIMALVFGMMKSSDAYQDAVVQAKAHPEVRQAIGVPIEEGLLVTGNINVSGPSGFADLAIPISGPDGSATIYVVSERAAGEWTFSTLVVEVEDTGQRIDLLVTDDVRPEE